MKPISPLSARVCDSVCFIFATWTLCCHLVVSLGGTFPLLLVTYALVGGGLLSLFFIIRSAPDSPEVPPVPAVAPPPAFSNRCLGGLILGLIGLLAAAWFDSPVLLWWWTVGLLCMAAAFFLREAPWSLPAVRSQRHESGLWLIALACVVLTLICHRPDTDDAFYINIAVAAVDFPQLPLLKTDTLHGIENLPPHLPVYQSHSYELWNAGVAYLTGIPAIYCFHWLSAALAACCVPLAYARLFRLLTPQVWLWAVLVLIIVLVATGETARWYGNFAFVRLWHGKSIFLHIFLPLIYSYALEFMQRPSRRTWFLLAAAQVAAIGCTSSALWAAPLSTLMTLACCTRLTPRGVWTAAVGAFSFGYLLVVGLIVRGLLTGTISIGPSLKFGYGTGRLLGEQLEEALITVLGDGQVLLLGVGALIVAWACCPRGLAQRFAIGLPLLALLILLNPYAEGFVMRNMTGPAYWRSLWAVPIPVLITLVLVAPLTLVSQASSGWRRTSGALVCLSLVAAFAYYVPQFSGLSPHNRVRISRPALKVFPNDYRAAAVLNRSVPPRSYVLAPPGVNAWLPTFHQHAYPLKVRRYLDQNWANLGKENFADRSFLVEYVRGTKKLRDSRLAKALLRFLDGIDQFQIAGVCLRRTQGAEQVRMGLKLRGFRRTFQGKRYEIWLRS